ncbi:MAG: hypothetical protein II988_06695 [Clostridia bacterium]|nr:hypothetical protein [Clostridia bacterium]MBQ3597478.1 hypothetical protein [Clostridia bacterium]
MANFIITKEQIEQIRPYMEDVEEKIKLGLEPFLIELNYAIVGELGDDYETTSSSDKLQKIYDDILNQN